MYRNYKGPFRTSGQTIYGFSYIFRTVGIIVLQTVIKREQDNGSAKCAVV